MSKRYYLCDVVGNGTPGNPFRPAVAHLGVNHVALIPADPATGRPLARWCLVMVATDEHAPVQSLAGVDALPDVALDKQWGSVDKGKSDDARAALARRGAAMPGVGPGDGYRMFVRGIGRQLQPDFSEDHFDVADTT